ncbi:MAG: hypothetical protein LBD23_02860 [Oscillospiraceae bacterium]|jgi:hypothetical protein|nr:hypothetical protein [Oscillospiraceae bacterium]
MDLQKSKKTTWIFFCVLLFSPFVIEKFVALITLTREPEVIWGTIHWIYCYIAYGAACFFYFKWQKRSDIEIDFIPKLHETKWLFLSITLALVAKRIFQIIAVYVFNSTVIHIAAPMVYRDFIGMIQTESIWMGIGYFVMQYIYYVIEFALIALMIDCAQKASIKMGWSQKIPWGGIFIALTWGLIHRYGIIPPVLRGEYVYSIYTMVQCLAIGFAYMLPGKKPIYAFGAIMAFYWL